jgi:5-methylcytosine-specific restriction endonuclease McrA
VSAHKHIYNSKRWKTLRERLLKARDYRCDECGWATSSRDLHADHVHELSDGGAPFDPDNIRFLCRKCHSSKTMRARHKRDADERDAQSKHGVMMRDADGWGMSWEERQAAKRS